MSQAEILNLLGQQPNHWFSSDEIIKHVSRANIYSKLAKLRYFNMVDYRRLFKEGMKEYDHIDGKHIKQPTKVLAFLYKSKGETSDSRCSNE